MLKPYPILQLKSGHDKRLKTGHPWIFSNELKEIPADIPTGTLAELKDASGRSYGLGFFNPNSLITLRLLFTDDIPDVRQFLTERITEALQLRSQLFPDEEAIRLIFGESDFLPGLVVDRYGPYLSFQILSAGMEHWKQEINDVLLQLIPDIKGVIEKNKTSHRNLEGLQQIEGIFSGDVPDEVMIRENGISYYLSLVTGQKTGFFLDQKINRRAIEAFVRGKRVLDCFCNQGGFALHAARAGAASVTGLDISDQAINLCQRNAELNQLAATFQTADVFRFLENAIGKNEKWDVIILDPPAFTKSKKNVPAAKKGYFEINKNALKLLSPGGFLVTSSCSHHLFEDTFIEMIRKASAESGRHLRQVFRGQQAPDHPILESMPETRYLKFFIYQVF